MTLPLSFIAASRQLPYIYVNNFKCGCSTIRRTLWASEHALGVATAPLHPHAETQLLPFVNDLRRWEHVDSQFVFTFVRNPYVRVLSAFLDKIARREPPVWGPFSKRHNLGEREISFLEFLRLIASESPETMDIHWRPQRLIIGTDIVPYNFVGAMETFAADLAEVTHTLFGPKATIETFLPHRTQAFERLQQYYGTEERAIVVDLFGQDFAALGYAIDLNQLERVQTAWPSVDAGRLRIWGRANRLVGERRFADAAKALETVRNQIAEPIVESMLQHCYDEVLRQVGTGAPLPSFAVLRQAHSGMPTSVATWKVYSRLWAAAGQVEDSLEAELHAIALRDAGTGRKRWRYWKLRRALALLRARQGRRAEAISTLQPSAAELYVRRPGGRLGMVAGTIDRTMVHLVASIVPLAQRLGSAEQRQPIGSSVSP